MCGRFLLAVDPAEMQEAFPGFDFQDEIKPRYNIAPSQPVLVLPNDANRKPDYFTWGLIPSWSKDLSIGNRMINARAETLAEKPSFRGSFKYRRCLIPTNGFYEWKKRQNSKVKQPYLIHLKNGGIFAFAGLWDEKQTEDGSIIKTFTIITTSPNSLLSSIHNRMPVILNEKNYAEWLEPLPKSPSTLQQFLNPYPSELMTAIPVSTYVNNPVNDSPECITPISLF
ncbi:SOS response-associated peptidase [Chloroflexota bacterium]